MPPPGSRAKVSISCSASAIAVAGAEWIVTWSSGAASWSPDSKIALAGSWSTITRSIPGTRPLSKLSHLPVSEGCDTLVKPVKLPAGRAKLFTRSLAIGSATNANRTGIVSVASLKICAASVDRDDEVGGAAHDEGCRSEQSATVKCNQGVYVHVVALDPSELRQLALGWREECPGRDVGNALYPISLLCVRCNRPRRRAEPRDERPPSHSITSSARRRNASGTVRPIAFAVLRLTVRMNLVGN
jgi:hypothetical protein